LGRDHFVKLVENGVLFPFGHVAKRITISERKFRTDEGADHAQVAYLRRRVLIFVSEPDKSYTFGRDDSNAKIPNHLRQLPFLAIKVTTVTTPSLDVVDVTPPSPFVPRVGGTFVDGPPKHFEGGHPFRFGFEALDSDGNIVSFTAPVVWIPAQRDNDLGVELPDPGDVDTANSLYSDTIEAGHLDPEDLVCPLSGQRFAYAPSNRSDDTVLETQSINFAGFALPDKNMSSSELKQAYPLFFPFLERASLAIEAVRQVSGNSSDAVQPYAYHQAYIENSFNASGNAGELMLTLHEDGSQVRVNYNKQSDRSGGFVSPNMSVTSLSRRIGPISGKKGEDAKAVDGKFHPGEFFAGLDGDALPLLFGVLKLSDILKETGLDQAPKYLTQIVTGAMGAIADLELLANSLQSVSVDVPTVLPSLSTLFDDLDKAFNLESPDQATAAASITQDIAGVVSDLGKLPTALASVSISPTTLKTDLLARAQKLASSLTGAVSQLLQMIDNIAQGIDFPKEIRTRMEWRGKVRTWARAPDDDSTIVALFSKFFVPFDPSRAPDEDDLDDADALLLAVEIIAKAEGDPQINIKCALEHFKLNLFGDVAQFLTLRFDLLEFSAQSGKKPDVRLLFHEPNGIEFKGPLKFIEKLKQLIPLDGFSDPPNLEVDASGIKAGFTLGLPNVSVGVLSLENISLSAALRIPFIGDPLTFSFNFSTRENPFNLTVSLLGGGGFFGLERRLQHART
ncbi:MAG TPA: hypothetical protein VNG33_15935, partial [Polyangiaceae bacterium]|nr:hypothetical protein [Polyangiaceae bacterium]